VITKWLTLTGVHVYIHRWSRIQSDCSGSLQISRRQVELFWSCHRHTESRWTRSLRHQRSLYTALVPLGKHMSYYMTQTLVSKYKTNYVTALFAAVFNESREITAVNNECHALTAVFNQCRDPSPVITCLIVIVKFEAVSGTLNCAAVYFTNYLGPATATNSKNCFVTDELRRFRGALLPVMWTIKMRMRWVQLRETAYRFIRPIITSYRDGWTVLSS